MGKYYLAVDIGASSGRHMLGTVKGGKMYLEEIYRFSNGMSPVNGELCWDVNALFHEIKEGMKKCAELGKIPYCMGIDTWAVDFVLLDKNDRIIGNTAGYRDDRTQGMDEEVYKLVSKEELYRRTGIQKQIFNTIYQLMSLKQNHPEQLEKAQSLLMIPDYFNFKLTGIKKQEYTNATTTQLVSPETMEWDMELIRRLGYPERLFLPLSVPGTTVGELSGVIQKEVGFNCQVVLPATHDTGSAVVAVPSNQEDVLYISSGTWSLMGTERMAANCSLESMKANFTNEGGYFFRFRFLKNIMGLWMIQSVKKELDNRYSFAELCEMASKETISSIVDCNDDCFLAPKSMTEAVRGACRESGQAVPETPGQLAAVIYNSLAVCYGKTLEEIEAVTGKRYGCVHIVGGGANAEYLNILTAKATKRDVYAGPTEATAIGNLTAQMLKSGEFNSLKEARESIFKSFEIKKYSA
ncbi:rhamnulokinase [Clostridium sp. MCC353]|uniref:rhamnulokinase n=1 Tax=Clostridium sp. MCC353 TaxID=2592646 RepID=UPI001C027253|nr:rhamnulokinase [Clostridium sp. MCC353]MBT9776318.1 rhamnulokinase [Clostridium sp. MCC353]